LRLSGDTQQPESAAIAQNKTIHFNTIMTSVLAAHASYDVAQSQFKLIAASLAVKLCAGTAQI
jgi:hypothetical protein